MATLKAPAGAQYYVNSHRYAADGNGLVVGVYHDDVPALLRSGCIATEPWSVPAVSPPPPPPGPPQPATVKLLGVAHGNYQPVTGTMFRAGPDGIVEVPAEHIASMLKMGCVRDE